MPTRPPPTASRPQPSQEESLRSWPRLVLLLLIVVSVVCVPVGAATSPPPTTGGSGAASASPALASLTESSPGQQATPVANNSSVRHRNPADVESESRLEELQRLLGSRLDERLAESAVQLNRSEYEQARAVLGEAYLQRLEQYGEVAGERDDENATTAVETYNKTRTTQREYSRTVEEFDETYDEYRTAAEEGDEERARELARELGRLGDEAARQSGRLEQNYTELGNQTGADLTTAREEVRATQTDIDETSEQVTAAEFVSTELRILRADERGSFTDPLSIEGTLDSEEGPVRDQSIRLRIGSQTSVVRTDSDGDFVASYRPTAIPANASTVTVRFVPADGSAYLPSNATIPVSLTATRASVTLERSTAGAGFGDSVTAAGRVEVDGTPVRNLTLAVVAGDVRLGTVRTGSTGAFTLTRPLPASVVAGTRQLSVTPAADGSAVRVPITTASLDVRETPAVVTATATRDGRDIRLTGSLTADGRVVSRQPVVVAVGGERVGTARTGADGGFALELDIDEMDGAATVSFDGSGTNLQSAETQVAIPSRTTAASTTATSTPAPAAGSAVGVGDLLSGTAPLTVENLLLVLTTPAGLVGSSLVLGLGGLALALLVRRRRDRTGAVAEPSPAPVADTAAEAAEEPDDGVTRQERSLAAATSAFEAGATNEAVVAAYGAVRAALVEELPTARARTHRQFLDAAVAGGVDGEALRTLTEVYEAAQYGAGAVSASAAETALDIARTLVEGSDEATADTAQE